ncbi:hypothetical protein GF327_01030 [Candidatus Woesearchaeota archaeon]|nr:hypothetical protein [Candidatus Woesearchaeota archaeon]
MQIIKHNELIPEKKWIQEISYLKTKKILSDKNEILKKLKKILIESVKKRIPEKKFGILFSGGIDSTLIAYICKKLNKDFTCYSVGLSNSKDVISAEKTAKKLDFDLKIKKYTISEVEPLLKKTINVLGKNYANVVNVGVGSVILATIKLGNKDNIDYFFSGLGSEEIFAGYQRHEDAKNITNECWNGLKNMWKRDFLRDYRIAKYSKVQVAFPFLDKKLIKYSMQIPEKYKITDNIKKYILRRAAVNMQIPEEFALRRKKAAQYGSGFDKAMHKLARKNNFKYKSSYLKHLKKSIE